VPGLPHKLPYYLIEEIPETYEFAYLGQPAKAKGFDHLINALLICAKNNIKPKTLLHAQGVSFPEHVKNNLPHCTFVEGKISNHQFYSDLISAKCIVTLYDVNNYQLSDSGIVTEAIAFNKFLISSKLPFIALTFGDDFAKLATVDEWTPIALANKMIQILQIKDKLIVQRNASLKARMLCSPTEFMKNVINI
jgi:glycosyltransferase involved in cell wall biosynthesis